MSIDVLETSFQDFDLLVKQVDLSIIITDSEHNLQILEKYYGHTQNHESEYPATSPIVLCACSLPVESYSTAWQLSHEFSHFILKHKGESKDIYHDWVHEAESKVDHCITKTHDIYNCLYLWTYTKSDSGKLMFMLPINQDYKGD